jgi:heat shock protein HslJ
LVNPAERAGPAVRSSPDRTTPEREYAIVSDVSGTQQLGQGAPRPAASLEGMPWLAVFYAGPEGRLRPVLLDTEVTATFQGGRVSGSAGCNTYTAGYQLAQDTAGIIRLEPAATTLRACAEPAGVMEQEGAYLRALERVGRYAVEADRLLLRASDGTVLLLYVPQPQRSLEGTDWVALDYNNGRGGVVSILTGTELTARFEGGQLSGSAGCNTYTAGYTLGPAAGALHIDQPASTRIFCAEPAGVMEQEAAYLAALPTATRYLIEGDRLTLQRQDGTDTTRVATYAARGT